MSLLGSGSLSNFYFLLLYLGILINHGKLWGPSSFLTNLSIPRRSAKRAKRFWFWEPQPTGFGQTKLINRMFNVMKEDNFRFQMIEEKEDDKPNHISVDLCLRHSSCRRIPHPEFHSAAEKDFVWKPVFNARAVRSTFWHQRRIKAPWIPG
jgi:hypothetical protein